MGLRPQGAMIARLPKARIIYTCFRPGPWPVTYQDGLVRFGAGQSLEGGDLFRVRLLRTILRKTTRRGYAAENV